MKLIQGGALSDEEGRHPSSHETLYCVTQFCLGLQPLPQNKIVIREELMAYVH